MAEFKLPDVGEGLTEAEIVSWKVKEGDTVEINEVIVEIETAKSLVELPSPFAGTVQKLLVPEGETVPVGTPIIAIGDAGGAPEGEKTPGEEGAELEIDLSNPAATGGGEGESLVGRNKADRGPVRRARRGAASPASEAGASTQLQVQGAFAPGGAQSQDVVEADEPAVPATSVAVTEPATARSLAKPPVRKLAKDLGVDLATLTGSGAGGVITR
ncbi:MAG TPA: biotin/lipoyl-containing protein [Nocardioides sp.]|nr:biotin/lipoyl-containing protein [Nocardioides sp.]